MTNDTPEFDPFAGGGILLTAPTTDPQQEIWLAVRLGGTPANLAYNESLSLELRGRLDLGALEAAVMDLAVRHEGLRTTFLEDGETLCVDAEPRIRFVTDDLSGLGADAQTEKARAIVHEEMTTPFDLVRGPLFRPRLLRFAGDRNELIFTAHHLICDGWSAGVLVSELAVLYRARLEKKQPELESASKFSDYAIATRKAQHGEEASAAERFWLESLRGFQTGLELPADRPRPLERNLSAEREDYLLDGELVAGLRTTAKKLGASLAAVLLASFDALLYRLTGQSDFVIAMPSAGQAAAGLDSLVGHCVNTLPLRLTFDPKAPFAEHVKTVKRAILDGAEYQQLSYGALLRKLDLPRDPSRVPLTPVIWNLDRRMADLPVGEATASFRTNARVSENFELFVNGTETDQGIVLETTFSTGLFERATIRRWMEELTVLMRAVVSDPTVALGLLPVLTDAEREQLVNGLNRTELALPNVPTVLELVEEQVRRSPDKVAVADERGTLTYAELDRQANHLAHRLREHGVKRDDCVGVCLERSARIPVVLLAVWKAGGAYVPLDPEYPPARLEYVAKDAAVRVLLTESHLGHVLGGMDVRRVLVDQDQGSRDDAPPRDASPSQLAYVLHTSGSTGQPKGVLIEQGSFVNLMASLMSWPGMKATDVLVAVITLSFDMSGVEIFLPLVSGAKVVIASRDAAMDANLLARLLDSSGATVLQATPVTWRFLVETPWKGGPNFRGFTGGEPLSPDLATAMLERMGEVWNLYGPTENTVYATGTRVISSEGITIGRPVANSQAYVLDEEKKLVPTGARGELYMGGRCVARGYLNRPDLTQERFLPDPFRPGPGAQLYRTGDVVHYDLGGNIVYEGRNDSQVKLRGFRIELGEIESLLNQHPTVRQSAAAVRDFGRGDKRLACYVVAREGRAIDAPALQDHLRSKVPPYMVPQHVVVLESMPLTPNGKINRLVLPHPDPEGTARTEYVAPTTEVQRKLADTWAELLRLGRVGVREAFFDLGGHSMLAVRMLARVRESFGVDLPIRTVFQAQTIEALSARIEAALVTSQKASDPARGDLEELEF